MHSISLLSALALVGSTFAAPVPEPNLVILTEVKTVYVTAGVALGVETAKPTQQANNNNNNGWHNGWNKPSSTVVVSTKPAVSSAKPTSSIKTPAASTKAPAATTTKPASVQSTSTAMRTATTSAVAQASSSSDPSYMSIVNKWRTNMKLATLNFNSTLQANALKTANDGNGQMVHELNPGTFGQVLAPGTADGFEKVFVGGWLCEVPSTPGLNNICSTLSQGWAYNGQTGHNQILVSTKYTKIGCALAKGIWACDLGY